MRKTNISISKEVYRHIMTGIKYETFYADIFSDDKKHKVNLSALKRMLRIYTENRGNMEVFEHELMNNYLMSKSLNHKQNASVEFEMIKYISDLHIKKNELTPIYY